jgi:twitching motility protein PilT
MQAMPLNDKVVEPVKAALSATALFSGFDDPALVRICGMGQLRKYNPGEALMAQGDVAESFFVIITGEVRVLRDTGHGPSPVEIGRVSRGDSVGEAELLLQRPRATSVVAHGEVAVLCFQSDVFDFLVARGPGFSAELTNTIARRLQSTTLAIDQISAAASEAAGMSTGGGSAAINGSGGGSGASGETAQTARKGKKSQMGAAQVVKSSPKLDPLLHQMVEAGASDVHLTARHVPRWRVDGEIQTIPDREELGREEVYDWLRPVMDERHIEEFDDDSDVDLAYAIKGLARFRVNMFRDHHGVGAVLRQIPDTILTIEQLGLPPITKSLCDHPKGLVVVTGPTGSGKSTTLAGMIDYINKTQKTHILTLEDPIEFVHPSREALINQREVGEHTKSFSRALRAALREDPDIVLVGEMRDPETLAIALETANTGHLVFGTLHTATAISTIDRIIDMFPAEQQSQVRTGLAESLRGVVAQALLKKKGGGRVAAVEIMVVNNAVSSLIRQDKTAQIMSIMQTGKKMGNQLLNDELARLVTENIVSYEEALSKSLDKKELAKLLNKPAPEV